MNASTYEPFSCQLLLTFEISNRRTYI
jgi:hypothetical protein